MNWKKLLALLLCAVLTVSLAAPALAAGSDDAALQAVTLKVKNVLDLDTEIFTDYNGNSSEDVLLGRRWYLNWSGDGVYLSITCDDNGKIYSYNWSESVSDEPVVPLYAAGYRFVIPSLPTGDAQKALSAARDFLNKVLDKGLETAELEDSTYPSLTRTVFRFNGTVKLNGVDSPISCSLTVRASDGKVTRFSRSDQSSGYQGELPTPSTNVKDIQARRDLRVQVNMEPFYVLQPDGKTARVVYQAKWGHDYYVDGKTGETVDLTELRSSFWQTATTLNKYLAYDEAAAEAPEASLASGGAALTQTELAGAAKLAGARDKEILDKAVRNSWPELGLAKYTLVGASYTTVEQPGQENIGAAGKVYDVTCRLTYQSPKTGSTVCTKYVTVNAKTGELLSVRGYRPYQEDMNLIRRAPAQAAAMEVLAVYAGDDFDKLELFDVTEASPETYSSQYTFTFCQKANGYFYRENRYTVTVDGVEGTVSGLSKQFDSSIELVKPNYVVSASDALTAYIEALDLRYGYVEVPVEIRQITGPIYNKLKDAGYTYVMSLRPGYTIRMGKDYVSGVDAQTGEAVVSPGSGERTSWVSYDDVKGTWVEEAANALALYEVGFPGGSLKGNTNLTQLDLLTLLASINGYHFESTDQDALDAFYEHCYYLGLVTPETRAEKKLITRGELIRMLLDAAGYQKIAGLKGIFTCTFSDKASIPADQLGYAALAQGLGLVSGGSDGAYAALRVATRAEAVALLYKYMK